MRYAKDLPATVAATNTTGRALWMRAMRDTAGAIWEGKSKRGRAPPNELVVMMKVRYEIEI